MSRSLNRDLIPSRISLHRGKASQRLRVNELFLGLRSYKILEFSVSAVYLMG